MSEMHPDPISETFRHASTNAQTTITGAARIIEQRLARQERQRRFEADQQRQAAEQARTEAATIRAAQAARERQMQATQEQEDLSADAADRPGTETDQTAAPVGADQHAEAGTDQSGPVGGSTVDQAVADAYPAGPAAAAARAASAAPTGAQAAQRTHGPGVLPGSSAGQAQPSVPEMG
jgi:hypothetical protein